MSVHLPGASRTHVHVQSDELMPQYRYNTTYLTPVAFCYVYVRNQGMAKASAVEAACNVREYVFRDDRCSLLL